MGKADLLKAEQLCHSSIEAAIAKLCEIETWPRPPRARNLRVGHDFYRDDLEDIEEVKNLLQYIASDDKIKSIYFQKSSKPELYVLYDYWEQLLLRILRETEEKLPTKRIFKKWFNRFIKELYSDTAVWISVDTITGLTLKATKLKFDNTTVLTSIPAYKWIDIIRREQQCNVDLDWIGIGHDEVTIITTVTISKIDHAGSTLPYLHLTKHTNRHIAAINAIRLSKPGVPSLHCFAQFPRSNFPISTPLSYCNREGHSGLYEKDAILDKGDFPKIRNLWRELMDTKYKDNIPAYTRSDPMNTPYTRFLRSYEMQSWLDSITDLTIAMESLFSPTDNEELRHRVSLRAAWLLSSEEIVKGSSDKVRNIVYDRVRNMYDIRSSRVHGGTPEKDDIRKWVKNLSGFEYDELKRNELIMAALESARDIVRKAIRACMKLPKPGGDGPQFPFPAKFDENIVIAGQRKVWQKAAGIRR